MSSHHRRRRPSTQTIASTATAPARLHSSPSSSNTSTGGATPSPRTPTFSVVLQTPTTSTTSTTNNLNYYQALVSPIHQRFIDLENRLKRWRIFRHFHHSSTHSSNRRSTSADPHHPNQQQKGFKRVGFGGFDEKQSIRENKSSPAFDGLAAAGDSPGSQTCPVPRKKLQMDLSGPIRPRPKLDPVSSSSDSGLSPEEVSNRFQIIQQKSGILNIGGAVFSGVQFSDLERVDQNAQLGDGAGGSVCKYKFRSRPIAVKQMKRTDSVDESKRIFMDLDVLSKCNDCPYIVKYYGYIINFDFVYICMEVMATCLEKLLSERQKTRPPDKVGLPEEIIGKITLSVVHALDYLKEKHKIMHRDVKPSNILLDLYGNVKLCDFGISGKLIESKAITKTGCTGYLAPERINFDSGGQMAYDVRADVWSLGISLVELAIGHFPYKYSTPFELMLKIKNDEPPVLAPQLNGFSPEFCQFIADCLQKDMGARPKFKDLLEKPFLQRAALADVNVGLWFSCPDEYEAMHGRS